MKDLTYIVLLFGMFCFESCDKTVAQKPAATDDMNYESLVQEKDSPLLFLDVTAKIKKAEGKENKKAQVIYGTISNTAMHTKFKDVTLTIRYYSAQNDLIDMTDMVVRALYEANTRTKFELNVIPPDSMQTFEVEIRDAKAAN
jgi:hypothetical protein